MIIEKQLAMYTIESSPEERGLSQRVIGHINDPETVSFNFAKTMNEFLQDDQRDLQINSELVNGILNGVHNNFNANIGNTQVGNRTKEVLSSSLAYYSNSDLEYEEAINNSVVQDILQHTSDNYNQDFFDNVITSRLDDENNTIFHRSNDPQIVTRYFSSDRDEIRNIDDETPLVSHLTKNNPDTIALDDYAKALLERGVDPNVCVASDNKDTLLHLADNAADVKTLLNSGADLSLTNDNNITAEQTLRAKNDPQINEAIDNHQRNQQFQQQASQRRENDRQQREEEQPENQSFRDRERNRADSNQQGPRR